MYNTNDKNLLRLTKKIKENPQSFLFVLGAGMSRPSGMPLWPELAQGMTDIYEQMFKDSSDFTEERIKRLRESKDYWTVFGELKRLLPENEYKKYIVERLSDKGCPIPVNYKLIWQLDVCGVVTFNMDKLILNAYSDVHRTAVDFATRKEFVKYNNFPASNDKFVFFPHGEISNASSWVLTEEEKKETYRDRNLKNVLNALLNGKNLVIVGFDIRENNFQSLLNDISIGEMIAGNDNYYIGANISPEDMRKFGTYGISCISYAPDPEDENHSDIEKMLKSIHKYTPKDVEYPTVYEGKVYVPEDIPEENKCWEIGLDKLRDILNGNIAQILPVDTVPTNEQIKKLQEFYKTYSLQLYAAWYVKVDSDEDQRLDGGQKLYGYLLKKPVGKGAFGNVYEAYNDAGERFAVKILLPEVKDEVRYLSCFRRGIRSMKMLKEHNVEGMVKIHSSYEVPACIVMDFVDGYTLRDAVDKKALQSFHIKLQVLKKMAEIINQSHNLVECILHRDLKPENVILKDFYGEYTNEIPQVVILDFDLSWHKGATELTVALGKMSQGFMAPEQTNEHETNTRNTAVDVFSIGMITYYVLTGRNPMPNQQCFSNFKDELVRNIRDSYRMLRWKCLPYLLAETVVKATMQKASNRLSLNAYLANIELALDMFLSDNISSTNPFLLRELAVQIDDKNSYEASDFGREITLETSELGKRIYMRLAQRHNNVLLQIQIGKFRMGSEERTRTGKYLENAKNKALSKVNSSLFQNSKGNVLQSEVVVDLETRLSKTITHDIIVQMAENIKVIRAELELK